jgi:hypothetical protein
MRENMEEWNKNNDSFIIINIIYLFIKKVSVLKYICDIKDQINFDIFIIRYIFSFITIITLKDKLNITYKLLILTEKGRIIL